VKFFIDIREEATASNTKYYFFGQVIFVFGLMHTKEKEKYWNII